MNGLADAFAPAEAHYRSKVMEATWGHLAPEKGKTYPGHMVFAHAGYGGHLVILESEWKGLDDSPWLFEAMLEFVCDFPTEPGCVYRFEGKLKNYEFQGTVQEIPLTVKE